MIETRQLTKSYQAGRLALAELDLTVKTGEIYCLLGANGAGKSTTINLLLDFVRPTSGRALINGIDVQQRPLEAKRYVAFLPENVMLYGNFTARENLEFFAVLARKTGLSKADFTSMITKAGLPESAVDQRVRTFSKGMRQKLGIAICMVKDAPALLLDEPTSGLDPKAAAEFVCAVKELREQGKAILLSTHDIFRAKEIADQVGILKEGRKVLELSRTEFEHENLERLYLENMHGGE